MWTTLHIYFREKLLKKILLHSGSDESKVALNAVKKTCQKCQTWENRFEFSPYAVEENLQSAADHYVQA